MKSADKCPSFTVISLSADGDVQAIEKVLKHYFKSQLTSIV